MLNTIRLLERIQKIDLEIKAAEDEEKSGNANMERLSSEIKIAGASMQALSAEIEELSAARRAVEERIRENAEKIKKDESRISDIKNTKELNALTREISSANKARKQNEQEKSALDSKIEEKKASLDATDASVKEKTESLGRLAEEVRGKKAAWAAEAAKALELRNSLMAQLAPEIAKKYENIRSKRGGMGIALVKDETCQGCYIHIPPQVYIMLRKGDVELHTCPHCHRILYAEIENNAEAV